MAEHDVTSNPSRPRPNDRLAELIVSAEPHQDAPPTPPYRRFQASLDDIQSPPYRSRSQVHLADAADEKRDSEHDLTRGRERDMVDEKHQPSETSSREHERHDGLRQTKGVHYPEDIPHIEKPVKFDSTSDLPSRAPSTAPSEDEHNLDKADDEDYDWSTDDDEVDEEAKKFEQKADGSKERSTFMK